MVAATHEASHRLFQEHPEALAPVFEALVLPPPMKKDFHELSPENAVTHFPEHGTLFEEKYLAGKSEGKAEGKSEAILRALKVRGLTVPDDVRERITGCTDLDTLATWFDRSLTVSEVEGLFAGEAEETTAS
ncbi:hypothetical protein FB570_1134 [Streptomyces sp. T12]|uniref:hypothetical protein n=1 Tax=Streptomyces sp. T12 TaxID=477697 RepID=UPI0011A56954|nr:hypothetical protein [Streptomyces sp. T12]TWD15159.1 hypothetical protein FB570_1134 [Streptomyces sp. T12]